MSYVKMIQQIILTILGVLVTLENPVVLLAAFRNRSIRENTHCNLVISLSFYDFLVGLTVILYGNMIVPNYDSNDENLYKVCAVYFCVTSWIYLTSLVQTFFISLNRYLVITESKLNAILWNGKRKYIIFCVTGMAIFILNTPILTSIMQGCDMDSILGNAVYAVMFGSFQALTLCLTFVFYFLTLWKIYKLHQKTDCNQEHIDNNRRRINRMRKRMVKSMKVVSLILITFMIAMVPAIVIGLKGVTSRLDIFILVCFSVSNSGLNPIIYCTQIDCLKKEIKTMFRIGT